MFILLLLGMPPQLIFFVSNLQVRTDDLLENEASVEALAVLVLDVHVDGGDFGDGQLPEATSRSNLRRTFTNFESEFLIFELSFYNIF